VTTLTLDSGSHLHPDAQKFAHVEPVRMQGLTVLGPDPYLAQQPVLRAQPASSDGATVRRPEVVDPEESMTDESPVKLAPPPPLKIEMEEGVVSPPAKETASSGSTR
jgi:hypothetical protein